ncbi:helix-turn-helix domain-containing protein [Duganella sp. BJB475]|uniref:helix-turn-helix domain-containing protein n=1 Tax=Duganella sp. BJB475 TaxID=2233914 RepID=UPI000E34E501|nr:helix-turn-helix domain-containing protein [Duganella sp. BJB475]
MVNGLAERLAWARAQREWTQKELADLAGVSQSTIGNLESGVRDSARKITTIAKVLGVNATWLAEGTGKPTDDGLSVEQKPAPVSPPPRNAHTQWIGEDEATLLDAYRTTDEAGRKSIRIAVRSVAKLSIPNGDGGRD